VTLNSSATAVRASPGRHSPPGATMKLTLIVHGDKDGTVPINQSQLLFEDFDEVRPAKSKTQTNPP
jgi:dipeptidyl aminopeptidase/acylaminoacyl peptidase